MKKFGIAAIIIFVIIGVSAIFLYEIYDESVNVEGIHQGVKIDGIDVSGMKKNDAYLFLKTKKNQNKFLRIEKNGHSIKIPYSALGYNKDFKSAVEEAYNIGRTGSAKNRLIEVLGLVAKNRDIKINSSFDEKAVEKMVGRIALSIDQNEEDAKLSIVNGEFQIKEAISGVQVDQKKTISLILNSVDKEEPIEIVTEEIKAKITAKDFERLNGIIGEFSTNYSSSIQNRKENIKLAANKINGKIILPGEQISFNETVGDITPETGFLPATVILDGEYEKGTGGGICQVSTTLYNASVNADLKIDERRNHSRPIDYVKLGMDCAVAAGFLDLKITNPFDFPVYIAAEADNDNIKFYVIGDKNIKNYDIRLEPVFVEKIPSKTVRVTDESLGLGEYKTNQKGSDGYRYEAYRIKSKDGEEISKELFSKSYYPPRDTIIGVGPGTYELEQAQKQNEEGN